MWLQTTGDANDNDIDMDELTYTYDKDGLSNLLVNVADAVTTGSTEGFKDGNTNPALDDYEYDANGNMIKDRNKGISNISYNHLNLPTQIEFEGANNKITYLYNSVGQKLKKTVVYSDSIKIVDYLDGFQYAGGELNFFPHPEGYVSVKRGGRTAPDGSQGYVFNYVFNYTDHLGNVRVSYSKDPQTSQLRILEENHYYPFGLKHSVYSGGRLRDFEVDFSNPEEEKVFLTPVTKTEYQYKYNGQEWQDELGLNMYAMDLRQYDPAIGRWVAQDPVTHFEYSPYNAFDNNPVFWADPSGADAVNIGYDRIVDSQDLMGSYHWSGGFQEIENEGGDGMETQKTNSSSSEQRASQNSNNGDSKKIDNTPLSKEDEILKMFGEENFEKAVRNFLKDAPTGKEIKRSDLKKTYGVPSDAAALIKDFTKISKTEVKVKWNGVTTWAAEKVSSARFKDGSLYINSVNSQKYGDVLKITGGAISIKDNNKIYNTIYVNNSMASTKLNSGYIYCIGTNCN